MSPVYDHSNISNLRPTLPYTTLNMSSTAATQQLCCPPSLSLYVILSTTKPEISNINILQKAVPLFNHIEQRLCEHAQI